MVCVSHKTKLFQSFKTITVIQNFFIITQNHYAISDGVEFAPYSAKSLRNWLAGLKAASAVTFCREEWTNDSETKVN